MPLNVGKEVAALRRMTLAELRAKHIEVFGEANRSGHKDYLVKRIIWRMQSNDEGGLTERAIRRAAELAQDANLRTTAPKEATTPTREPARTKIVKTRLGGGERLPMPGAVLTREYKGKTIQVMVLQDGFDFEGEVYRSLSAVAKAITGAHWNGFHFFGIPRSAKP